MPLLKIYWIYFKYIVAFIEVVKVCFVHGMIFVTVASRFIRIISTVLSSTLGVRELMQNVSGGMFVL